VSGMSCMIPMPPSAAVTIRHPLSCQATCAGWLRYQRGATYRSVARIP